MSRKYKVGITFNLEAKVKDIWANGANQNVIFLYQLLEKSNLVDEVYLVSWGPEQVKVPDKSFMLDNVNIKFALINDVINDLDVLIEGSLIIEPDLAEKIHKNNGKVVCYKMGNDFIMDIESFLFDKKAGRVLTATKFDAVWTIPQHENTCHSYFSIMYRCPTYIVPAIWGPDFCNIVIQRLKENNGIEFGYLANVDKSDPSRRISSFESNITIVKNCFTDILIAEQAYRTEPELIKHVYMCNTYDRKDNPTFFNFIGRTNLVKNNIMTVEGRYQMPDFLSRYTDIVLSTQWENGLNYAYNDALYGGYPFIHNSRLLPKGVGYYYDQFDAYDGARVLLDVIKNHDKNHDAYIKRANEYLDSIQVDNPVNIYRYERELRRLFEN